MHTTKKQLSDTKVRLTITADESQLRGMKEETLRTMARRTRIPGFRPGKAPLGIVEKHVDHAVLQAEFLDLAVNRLYADAVNEQQLRPVSQPSVTLQKFVPFGTLEMTAEVEVVGEIVLANYKKIRMPKKTVSVSDDEVREVLNELQLRQASKKEVQRAAEEGDEIVIDFKGNDSKTGEQIAGAAGTDYPITIGSNVFIPGFEKNLVGMKPGEEKTFEITFPADYSVAALRKKKADFMVKVKKVQELEKPAIDDEFASKAGPFKTLDDLKSDIRKQLQAEKQYRADREYTDELLTKVTNESKAAVPESLVSEQLDRMLDDQRRNAAYRGKTWQEFLQDQGMTEEDLRVKLRADAEFRVKAGLIVGAIADKEGVSLTRDELDSRIVELKRQYTDPAMQEELDKADARREIASRIISEKAAGLLVGYASGTRKSG